MNASNLQPSRRAVLATAAASGLSAVAGRAGAVPPAQVESATRTAALAAPWTRYQGAVRQHPGWAATQRGGNFANADGSLDTAALRQLLETHDLLSDSAPHPNLRSLQGMKDFLNLVHNSGGSWWRDAMQQWTTALINTHATAAHDVVAIQMHNEINTAGQAEKIRAWTQDVGLPFPHPNSNFGDGIRDHTRDHIGYYVEYFLAPGVAGIRAANADAGAHWIPILLGSIFGARHTRAREQFLPALLNYQIEGTLAPSLAGKRVKFIVHYLAIHYLLSVEKIFGYTDENGVPLPGGYHDCLTDLHNRWLGNGWIEGIWHTEEGGNQAYCANRHGSLALRIFARMTGWAIDNNASPDQARVFGYYLSPPNPCPGGEPRPETSWSFALNKLHAFLGNAELVNRSAGLTVNADDRTENHAFETSDGQRRVLLVTPQTDTWQGPTTVRSVSTAAGGWNVDGRDIDAQAHLFKSDEEGYATFSIDVTRRCAGCPYDIVLPEPIALNPGMQMLMITLTGPAGTAAE